MSYLRNLSLAAALIVTLGGGSVAGAEQEAAKEEAAVRQAGRAYLEALQQGDAKRLAALWTATGIFVDATGHSFSAHKLIAEHFGKDPGTKPTSELQIDFDSTIRFVTRGVAIEEGTSGKASSKDAPTGHFTAVWVKQGETWLLDKLRERDSADILGRSALDSLRWMIGDWVGESEHGKIQWSGAWSEGKKFIVRRFSVEHAGDVVLSGTERIGWDPAARRIRSWTFDSHGGIVEGSWVKEGDSWIAKTRGSLPDGSRSSAANFWIAEGPDRAVLKSTHVKIGETEMDDSVLEFQRTEKQ